MDPLANVRGAVVACGDHLTQDLHPFGVICHRVHVRPRQHEVRVGPRRDLVTEGAKDSGVVLEPVPARDLQQHGRARRNEAADDLCAHIHARGGTVQTGKVRSPRARSVLDPATAKHRCDGDVVHGLVLR